MLYPVSGDLQWFLFLHGSRYIFSRAGIIILFFILHTFFSVFNVYFNITPGILVQPT
jgi:hypothetical protein